MQVAQHQRGFFNRVTGDATYPIGIGNKIIAHICNDAGCWGKGFVAAVSKKWSLPEQNYRSLKKPIDLGFVQFVDVSLDITVANMVAQVAPTKKGRPPIRYHSLRNALRQVANQAKLNTATIHMPRIGTGLSRGSWDVIKEIIYDEIVATGLVVFVYEF